MEQFNYAELSSKLIQLATATDEVEKERLKKEIAALSSAAMREEAVAFLKFSEKEFKTMPQKFRKLFKTKGLRAHVRKRERGNSVSYEIRCRQDGYNICTTAKTLEEAKKRFIEKLHTVELGVVAPKVPTTFHSFTMFYFDNFRARKVSPRTFIKDKERYRKHLLPYFNEIPLREISPIHCQKLLDKLTDEGKGKTADEIHTLMNLTFKCAIAHGLIQRNPLAIVYHEQHERVHGKALSKEEEAALLSVQDEKLRRCFAIALYTGLRPGEYTTLRRKGQILYAVNSKRKKKKVVYKRIPINPMLAPYIGDGTTFDFYGLHCLRDKLRQIIDGHKLYDLRTTFYTRCKESDVAMTALKEMVGHSDGTLDDTYSDLSDEYLIREANKISYDLPPALPPK